MERELRATSAAESRAVLRALEDLAVEVDGGLELRRVVRTFSNARVRWQIEAAPLRQLLKLVLVHFFYLPILSSLSLFLFLPPLSLLFLKLSSTGK